MARRKGFRYQSALERFGEPLADTYRGRGGMTLAKVVQAHPENHAVDVVTMGGAYLRGVQVAGPTASTQFGRVVMTESALVDPITIPSGVVDTPEKSGSQDVYAVIGYLGGDAALPVALGFLYPENSEMLGLPAQAVERFPGGHYFLVDSNEEGFEFVFSDLSYFRAGPGYTSRTVMTNYDGNWKHIGGGPHNFIFYQEATGNKFLLTKEGDLKVELLKSVSLLLGSEDGCTIDVPESLGFTGQAVDFADNKPTAPNAFSGGAGELATLDDVMHLIEQEGGGGQSEGGEVYWKDLIKEVGDFTTIEEQIAADLDEHVSGYHGTYTAKLPLMPRPRDANHGETSPPFATENYDSGVGMTCLRSRATSSFDQRSFYAAVPIPHDYDSGAIALKVMATIVAIGDQSWNLRARARFHQDGESEVAWPSFSSWTADEQVPRGTSERNVAEISLGTPGSTDKEIEIEFQVNQGSWGLPNYALVISILSSWLEYTAKLMGAGGAAE